MTADTPTVGRIVWFQDRDEYVAAQEQKREPTLYAAVVTAVNVDPQGKTTDSLSLGVFHPEAGYTIQHDVLPIAGEQTAPGWKWPEIVSPTQQKAAKAAEEKTAKDEKARDEKNEKAAEKAERAAKP